MIEQLILLLMIVVAFFCVTAENLRKAIIGLGVFSLLATACYLVYHAPDVALTEAVIGSALTTILYIIALKKYSSFYVYFSSNTQADSSDQHIRQKKSSLRLRSVVREYCTAHELAPQIVYTWEAPEVIAAEHIYDLILHDNGGKTTVYGIETDDHYNTLKQQLTERFPQEGLLFASLKEDI